MKNTIIYLIGFAGVGKYTIAKEIAKLAKFRIVDNQLINNPIFSVVETESGYHFSSTWRQINKIRNVVLETIKELSPAKMNFLLTNELIEGGKGELELYKKIEAIAEFRKSNFMPVRLLVDKNEHLKRITSPERKEKLKVTDEEYLYKIEGYEILKPKHKNTITLDTSNLSPQESAKFILNKIKEFS